jgi:hypothetical protein
LTWWMESLHVLPQQLLPRETKTKRRNTSAITVGLHAENRTLDFRNKKQEW